MVDVTAKIVLDSAHPRGDDYRLTTFLVRYPKFVHAEHMRHRTGSYCVSSSRAVPVSKNLEEVRSDELRAGPVFWGAEQKGMQSGEELSDELDHDPIVGPQGDPISKRQWVKNWWGKAAMEAAHNAEVLAQQGVHKSIVNRLLEPFLHVNVLVTSCSPGLLNFFGLRLDKAAQPEIKALAEEMWKAWNESKPRLLQQGYWHLPFIGDDDMIDLAKYEKSVGRTNDKNTIDLQIKVSTARCARLSYTSFETNKRSTVEEDLKLYDRLITSRPIHASPAEHQATPDQLRTWDNGVDFGDCGEAEIRRYMKWQKPELHGNLCGWVQHRKLLLGEAVAELPEAYR